MKSRILTGQEPPSGYRKIKSLIKNNLLVPGEFCPVDDRKRGRRCISALENIRIYIDKGNLVVKVRFTKI